ncbi:ParB/RepB/Spo0J family partition protein [Streptomyces sp. NPDC002133]|uniref:ParB/RepB/Spo0J family partition protein n=1 Tax=Streptomyces sp. NPDC002133 TaxID=3154409 RepID=UPI00332C1871
MAVNFGVPPLGETIRSLVKDRLRAAMDEQGAKITVEWRGEQKHLHVISMPVDMLYFNPDTHRIRAQRTLDPQRNRILEEEPWGEAAQNYLFDLLRRSPSNPNQTDPDYIALQGELDDFGQKEPGIISPLGILVDGNTRCAALRELGIKDIRVGVLPEDTSRRDINSVELALQLRRDKRRDYSYINRLIAIEDELSSGRREEDVARDFNIKTTTLQQDRWVYQLINDAIDRSATEDGAALRLVDFEDHQEKLRELQRDFTKLAKTDSEAAEQLKESRLAMVVLNYPKTTVRLAESDFHARYLDERLPDDLRPAAQESAAMEVPGLPGVVVEDASAAVKTTRALTDALLQAKAISVTKQLGESGVADADKVIKTARKTFDVAVKLAGANAELRKRQIAVPERLTDAADYVNQCAREFADAKAKHALDEDAFDDALLTLRTSLAQLAKHARRTFSSPGDGVAWLLDATREK